jgi:hypothetical protein
VSQQGSPCRCGRNRQSSTNHLIIILLIMSELAGPMHLGVSATSHTSIEAVLEPMKLLECIGTRGREVGRADLQLLTPM